jgi:hypothetical protein
VGCFAILAICAFGRPDQAGLGRHKKTAPLPGVDTDGFFWRKFSNIGKLVRLVGLSGHTGWNLSDCYAC